MYFSTAVRLCKTTSYGIYRMANRQLNASTMRTLLLSVLLFGTLLMTQAQQHPTLDPAWKKIETQAKSGKYRTTLNALQRFYQQAQKANHTTYQVKAALNIILMRARIDEDDVNANLKLLDSLIATSKAPAKQIFLLERGKFLQDFLQESVWDREDGPTTTIPQANDIESWSLQQLEQGYLESFAQALEPASTLQQVSLQSIKDLINPGENALQLRPTLFDLIAHDVIEQLSDKPTYDNQPTDRFTMQDPRLLGNYTNFLTIPVSITKPYDANALLVNTWKALLQFHTKTNPAALQDADQLRLQTMLDKHQHADKDEFMIQTLKQYIDASQGKSEQANWQALLARQYLNQVSSINDPAKKGVIHQQAHDVAQAGANLYPQTNGGKACKMILQEIKEKSFSLQLEQVELPNAPFRLFTTYRNIDQIHFRLIPWNNQHQQAISNKASDEQWMYLRNIKSMHNWSATLPKTTDYLAHRVELKVDGLPVNQYMLLASYRSDFSIQQNILGYIPFHISNLSVIKQGKDSFFVLQRSTGFPVAQARVEVWEKGERYYNRSHVANKLGDRTTNSLGAFNWTPEERFEQITFRVYHGSDSLLLDEAVSMYHFSDNLNSTLQRKTTILTDRAIYRPGQIIFFKGIVSEQEGDAAQTRLSKQRKGIIKLKDANQQEVASLEYETNSFGSFQGSFKIPENILTGRFTLEDSQGPSYENVQVEAYKRPKFYAELQAPKTAYQLNDTIAVTGVAKAYTGQPVGTARVRYQVHRTTEMPMWWRWWGPRQSQRTQISFGETQTGKDGTFDVRFPALPDLSSDPSSQPRFLFEVSVDVIDMQGETQSKSITVPAAYQTVFLTWDGSTKARTNQALALTLNALTIQNEPVNQEVHVTCAPLQYPKRFIRKRYWEEPDQFLYTDAEFRQWFPNDEYKTETDPRSWTEEKTLFEFDATVKNGAFSWPTDKNVQPGWYKIIAVGKDSKGQEVRAETTVEIQQADGRSVWQAQPLDSKLSSSVAQPGETARLTLYSNSSPLFLIRQSTNRQAQKQERISLAAGKEMSITLPIQDADRGNIQESIGYVWNNRLYNESKTVLVPWTNKTLQLNLNTHRDFTLPGSQETWSLQITNHEKKAADAELAATLYDESLDQFAPHQWSPFAFWPSNYQQSSLRGLGFEAHSANLHHTLQQPEITLDVLEYPTLENDMMVYSVVPPPPPGTRMKFSAPRIVSDGEVGSAVVDSAANIVAEYAIAGKVAGVQVSEVVTVGYGTKSREKGGSNNAPSGDNKPRRDFRETAFFQPQLRTDSAGRIQFSFQMPEALTRWKGLFLAHDAQLASGTSLTQITTRKQWMVQANLPRFLREGDQLEIPVKVSNLDSTAITGTVSLELIDARTQKSIDGWLKNVFPNQYATVDAGQSQVVKFPIEIPYGLDGGLLIRVSAKSAQHSDGEEHVLPILPNRMLITESLPLQTIGNETKSYTFKNLLESRDRATLSQRGLTLQYTSNPLWYAVQSLPYLMEYPWECAEQTFNRYFANQLASHLTQSIPGLQNMFERWKQADSTALKSALANNQELKQTLLQETPWVLEAQSQEEQYKRLALLFDLQRMQTESNRIIEKLQELQSEEGWFSWFKGGYPDLQITTYILAGIGQLQKLQAISADNWSKLKPIQESALEWLDKQWVESYKKAIKAKKSKNSFPDVDALDYLYMRSFFPKAKMSNPTQTSLRYWKQQLAPVWLKLSLPNQARLAIIFNRENNKQQATAILDALDDQLIRSKELGSYWKAITKGGYYWSDARIENHALMIEAFREVSGKHQSRLGELKTWLLLQKQTQHWESTKATAAACFALLWQEDQTLSATPNVSVNLGKTNTFKSPVSSSTGVGSWEEGIPANSVEPQMGNVQIAVSGAQPNQVGWGAIHWQYYEQLDQIKSNAGSAVQLKRALFREIQTDQGTQLQPIDENTLVTIGDKLVVQIRLQVDRSMEYVHLKDMRAANLEPINVLSEYQYRNGLSFYQATSDASMNFFFSNLPKGKHTLEYRLTVQQAGNCSMGISSVQCMYAPQFNSHSPGIRLNIPAND